MPRAKPIPPITVLQQRERAGVILSYREHQALRTFEAAHPRPSNPHAGDYFYKFDNNQPAGVAVRQGMWIHPHPEAAAGPPPHRNEPWSVRLRHHEL